MCICFVRENWMFWTEMCENWDYGQFVCVLKFDSPLPEDLRANILSTADSLRHHCKLCGGSASILGTSVYRGSKWVGGSSTAKTSKVGLSPPETGKKPLLARQA